MECWPLTAGLAISGSMCLNNCSNHVFYLFKNLNSDVYEAHVSCLRFVRVKSARSIVVESRTNRTGVHRPSWGLIGIVPVLQTTWNRCLLKRTNKVKTKIQTNKGTNGIQLINLCCQCVMDLWHKPLSDHTHTHSNIVGK